MEKYDFENLNGVQWAHLLCEHPEFADKCDWSKLNSEDWELLLSEQPQFCRTLRRVVLSSAAICPHLQMGDVQRVEMGYAVGEVS